jgi:hypothetical protein
MRTRADIHTIFYYQYVNDVSNRTTIYYFGNELHALFRGLPWQEALFHKATALQLSVLQAVSWPHTRRCCNASGQQPAPVLRNARPRCVHIPAPHAMPLNQVNETHNISTLRTGPSMRPAQRATHSSSRSLPYNRGNGDRLV